MSGFSDSGSAGFSDSGSAGIDDESSAGTTYFGDGGRMSSIADSAWTVDQGFNTTVMHSELSFHLDTELEEVKVTNFQSARYLDVQSNTWVDKEFLVHGKIEAASHNDSNMNSSLIGEGKNIIFLGGRGNNVFQGSEGVDFMDARGMGTNILRGEGGDDIFLNLKHGKNVVYGGTGANTFGSTKDDNSDEIYIKPDGNADVIEGLDSMDKIFFEGVNGSQLEFAENVSYVNQDGVKSSGIGIYVSGSLEALVKLNYRAPEKYNYDEREEIGIKTLEEVALVSGGSSAAIFSSSSSSESSSSNPLKLQPLTKEELPEIKDYDGNLHGGADLSVADDYRYQGIVDVNGDGNDDWIYTNEASGRWAILEKTSNEIPDWSDFGAGGGTRIVGIYEDPLVANGEVEKGSPHDSQVRFQNDLYDDNLRLGSAADVDNDGFGEVFWKTTDGSAFLRSIHHLDGNVKYANYMNSGQMTDYLSQHGHMGDVGSSLGL